MDRRLVVWLLAEGGAPREVDRGVKPWPLVPDPAGQGVVYRTTHALMVLDDVQGILAIELLCAAQAVDFRRRGRLANAALGQGTQPAYDLLRQRVPFLAEDAYLAPLIAQVKALVVSGELAVSTENIPTP